MPDDKPDFPKWVFAVFSAIVLGAGWSIWSNTQTLAILSTKVDGMINRMDKLEGTIAEGTRLRYTSEDASRDRTLVLDAAGRLDTRVTALEADVRSLREWRSRTEKP